MVLILGVFVIVGVTVRVETVIVGVPETVEAVSVGVTEEEGDKVAVFVPVERVLVRVPVPVRVERVVVALEVGVAEAETVYVLSLIHI